jgi:hypothetical protein
VFARNIGAQGLNGGAVSVAGATVTWRNVSFIDNVGFQGAVIYGELGNVITMIDCFARSNEAENQASGFYFKSSEIYIFNSSFADGIASNTAIGIMFESTISAYNTTFRDNSANGGHVMDFSDQSIGSFIECRWINNRAMVAGALTLSESSTVNVLRSMFIDNTAGKEGGCFNVVSGSAMTIDDSDMIHCVSETTSDQAGGVAMIYDTGAATSTTSTLTITNSRIHGSTAANKGSIARVGTGGNLRITGTTITDNIGQFAIYDASGSDFAVQVRVRRRPPPAPL